METIPKKECLECNFYKLKYNGTFRCTAPKSHECWTDIYDQNCFVQKSKKMKIINTILIFVLIAAFLFLLKLINS